LGFSSSVNVLPSGSSFPINPYPYVFVSWNGNNLPPNSQIRLDLLSADGTRSLGILGGNAWQCSNGGEGNIIPATNTTYKWSGDGTYIQLSSGDWQSYSVQPGTYKIGVTVHSEDSKQTIYVEGQSAMPFTITPQLDR